MISCQVTLSNKTIRRGDQFGIYLTIRNGFEKNVEVINSELTCPMGFNRVKQGKDSGKTDSGTEASTNSFSLPNIRQPVEQKFIFPEQQPLVIPPGGQYRYEYLFKAGRSIGTDPKPDTHTISFKINYKLTGDYPNYQEPINVEVSIFPAFTSMLLGTLTGGFLGTMAGYNFNNFKWIDLLSTDLLGKIVINLIFSFIAGVVLMRRKDVQSFITIEDFWGGILIGFIIGYGGVKGIQSLLGPPFQTQNGTTTAT